MTANQLLTALFNAGIAISVGATVLSLGMTFTVGQLVAPLHRVVLVIAMVVLNAVVIPAASWGLAEISPMGSKYVPGLATVTATATATECDFTMTPGDAVGPNIAALTSSGP